jgi:hypothetical protein
MQTMFRVPPKVIGCCVGEEAVILKLETGVYFGLDPVGTRVWQLLEAGDTLTQICEVIFKEYEVSRKDLERDVLDFVKQLLEKQLLTAA